jgi:hypothetical protein
LRDQLAAVLQDIRKRQYDFATIMALIGYLTLANQGVMLP